MTEVPAPAAGASGALLYRVVAYVNVGPDNFSGYRPGAPLAEVRPDYLPDAPLRPTFWLVWATSPERAAERFFAVGNRMEQDAGDRDWPSDVRSLSVGDVLAVKAAAKGLPKALTFYAVERFGWRELPSAEVDSSPIVELAGTEATSR